MKNVSEASRRGRKGEEENKYLAGANYVLDTGLCILVNFGSFLSQTLCSASPIHSFIQLTSKETFLQHFSYGDTEPLCNFRWVSSVKPELSLMYLKSDVQNYNIHMLVCVLHSILLSYNSIYSGFCNIKLTFSSQIIKWMP